MQRTTTEGNTATRVNVALLKLKGNDRPYFSVTADVFENGRWAAGGCQHDTVLRLWPDLADVVALHLSDDTGQPMHAAANGWYWLAGIVGGMGQQYHGGNGSSARTPEQCTGILARHLRITEDEVAALAKILATQDPKTARAMFVTFVSAQTDRWQREAAEAIAKYALTVTER
jgi:post-segregation antitoxin (ccd killing protein)